MWERRRQVRGLKERYVEEPRFSEEDHRLKHRVWLPYLVVCGSTLGLSHCRPHLLGVGRAPNRKRGGSDIVTVPLSLKQNCVFTLVITSGYTDPHTVHSTHGRQCN